MYYILKTTTDESYDIYEERFMSSRWEPQLEDTPDYLQSLINMHPEKFADCEIVEIAA